jgi:hypothetical protein
VRNYVGGGRKGQWYAFWKVALGWRECEIEVPSTQAHNSSKMAATTVKSALFSAVKVRYKPWLAPIR